MLEETAEGNTMRRKLIIVLLVVAAAACASSNKAELQVRVDFDDQTDFSAWKSFRFATFRAETTERSSYKQIENDLRNAIEANLVDRGYIRIEDGAPDFRIAYAFGTRGDSGTDPERSYANDQTSPDGTTPSKTNTIVVKMLHPSTGETLWDGRVAGFSLGAIQQKSEIRGAVWRLFVEFPPITR